jgi:hypothetical protein
VHKQQTESTAVAHTQKYHSCRIVGLTKQIGLPYAHI